MRDFLGKPAALAGQTNAFTLVELIVVITILAILATVGFLSLSGYSDDARGAVVKANVRMVYSAISTESATSGRSPRYYVDHDPAAGISWAVTVGNTTVTLSGGQWDVPNTNYSSGNPRWDLLRLNPDKFRLSLSRNGIVPDSFAAYESGSVSVGAVDVQTSVAATGKKLIRSVFQVTAVSPSTGGVSTMGTYSTGALSDLAGLVKNPSYSNGAVALVDTTATSSQSSPVVTVGACGSANWTTLSSAPSANLCSSGTASAVSGTGPWTWSCIGSGGGISANCSANPVVYSVSGTFWGIGSGGTVSVCWVSVTVDANGNFVRSNIPAGTVCNNVIGASSKSGYSCTTSSNGPASLASNATDVMGYCMLSSSAATTSTTFANPMQGWRSIMEYSQFSTTRLQWCLDNWFLGFSTSVTWSYFGGQSFYFSYPWQGSSWSYTTSAWGWLQITSLTCIK